MKYWQYHRNVKSEAASAVYQKLLSQLPAGKSGQAITLGQSLITEYDGTPYAGKAALLLAKIDFESGDRSAAQARLEWAVKNAKEDSVQHVARLRLGYLLVDQAKLDDAMRITDIRNRGGFESAYEELRGDIFAAKGDRNAAHEAYKLAIEKLPKTSGYGKYLFMKRDSTAPAGNR